MERVVERGEKGWGGGNWASGDEDDDDGFREKGGGGMLKYKINILNPA